MAVFMFIYLRYRINKQRDTSFEFSLILSTVDLSKHLITAWIIWKFKQLVYFVTFSVFFFFFGNWVWLNLDHERALSVTSSSIIILQVASVYKNIRARIYSMQSISAIRYWVLNRATDRKTTLNGKCSKTRANSYMQRFRNAPCLGYKSKILVSLRVLTTKHYQF